MEPITREEYYLAKIAGTYKGKTPKPVTIEEYYLATMAGDYSGNTPQPVTRLQYYMAKVAGVWGGSVPAPVTRLEYYWAAIANGEGEVFPPVTREEHFLTLVADAYSVVLTVVTGNPALLENSKGNRGLESLTLHGISTQGSTTGAQLFDKMSLHDGYVTTSEIISTPHNDYYRSDYIPVSGDDIIISGVNFGYAGGSVGMMAFDAEKQIVRSSNIKTMDIKGCSYVMISVPKKDVDIVMLNYGSTALPWEPYTGGVPSPSPSYPQEIESAGQDGEIGVEVLGKNLIPFPYPILGGAGTQIERGGVKYTVQSDGGIRCVGTPTAVEYINLSRIKFSDVGLHAMHPTDGKIVLSGEKMTYDPSNYALFIYITSDQLGKPIDTVIYPQIELGTVATEYEPYKPAQTLIVPTPNGLPGIPVSSGGNYTDEKGQQWVCDEVDFKKGVYVQRIAKYISSGGENLIAPSTRDGVDQYIIAVKSEIDKNFLSFGFSNKFKCKNMFEANTFTVTDMFIYFRFAENTQTPETIREVLNGCEFWYVLATPIETPLSSADLAAYSALRTYSPTTTVINDAGAGMSVGYAKMK